MLGADDFNQSSKGQDRLSVSLLNEEKKPLSTVCNLILLFLFTFFSNAAYMCFSAIALLKYISWGLTLIDTVNAGLIFLTVSNFTQANVGIYGDKVVTKYGRRKTFVTVGMLIRLISILFICSPPVKHTNLLFAWYVIFGSIHQIGFGISSIPFTSWMIESTVDEADYMKVNIITGFFGGAIGAISGATLVALNPLLASIIVSVGGAAALAGIVVYIPTVIYRQAPIVPKPIPSLRICAQSKEFRTILYMSIAINSAANMFSALIIFIFATCFGLNNQAFVVELTIVGAVLGIILGLVALVCCNFILQKVDKIRVMVVFLWIFIALLISIFFLTFSNATLYPYLIVTIIIGIIAVPGGFILSLFMRDLVIFDTFVTRYNRENMYLTAQSIPSAIISSFIAAIPIVLLTLTGFKSNDVDDDNLHDLYTWNAASLWIMRISTSFVCAGFGLIAYYLVRSYPLTQKVCDKMNTVVKHRQQVRESGDLELRDDSATKGIAPVTTANGDGNVSSSVLPVALEDDVIVPHEEREALLHLSVAELYRVHAAIDSQVYRPEQGLLLIKTLLKYGFSSAMFALLIMVIALVFNTVYLQGLFSTLIIYFILIVAFYAFYEFFRYTTVREILNWNPQELKVKSKKVYEEFTKKGDNLAVLLSREGIYLESSKEDEDEVLGIAPQSIVANDLKEEDVAEEAFVGLSGYKRIFGSLFILIVLSLVVIIVSVA